MKIYLIDDDAISNYIFESLLSKTDYLCGYKTFLSGEEALKSLLQEESLPEIIFLDLTMPLFDGWDFLNALAPHQSTIGDKCKVYILTSSLRLEDEARSKNYPIVAGYIQKPIREEDITAILSVYKK